MSLLHEAFDVYNASDDHMEALTQKINIAASNMSIDHKHQQLAPETRQGCAKALYSLLHKISLPTSWFHAMTLLDVYCCSGCNTHHEDIQALVAAIAFIVGKLEGANTSNLNGFIGGAVAKSQIERKEMDLVEVFHFRLNCPTIRSWLDMFLPRLWLMMSAKHLFPSIQQLAMASAQEFVYKNVCIPGSELRQIAHGILGMACVMTARKFGLMIAQPCELPDELQMDLLSSIGIDIDTLGRDCEIVQMMHTFRQTISTQV